MIFSLRRRRAMSLADYGARQAFVRRRAAAEATARERDRAHAILLSTDELKRVTGYARPTDQLKELLRQGFWRARRINGHLILEREHYLAVCAGSFGVRGADARPRPMLASERAALEGTHPERRSVREARESKSRTTLEEMKGPRKKK